MRACKITQITIMRGQLKSSLPFSLFLFVWRLESTTTKSLSRHLHCRGSPLFKSRRQKFCSKWREQHGRIRRFAVGPMYPNKSLTICSSDFVFRKYKQDSTFRVSGVFQLLKTGTPVTKNFPLLLLFPTDAMMAWRFYTPYDINRTNLHILTARRMSHIWLKLANFEAQQKICTCLSEAQTEKLRISGS